MACYFNINALCIDEIKDKACKSVFDGFFKKDLYFSIRVLVSFFTIKSSGIFTKKTVFGKTNKLFTENKSNLK